jgi:hypothetical protein
MRPDELFGEALAASERALAAQPARERAFRIAGLPVRVRFAGAAMEETVTPALAHLEEAGAAETGGLTVNVWDCESAGIAPPLPSSLWNDCTPWGELAATRGSAVHASRLLDVGVYSMLDLEGNRAVFWAHRAAQIPPYARAAALRSILHAWMRARGLIFLHGAAVATEGGGVLLAGRGGCGKSTTALLCAQAGWRYLGDDYCLACAGNVPRAFSLYNSAKLSPDQKARFSRWAASPHAVEDPQSGKLVVFLAFEPEVRTAPEAALCAIVLPRIGGGTRTILSDAGPVEAWKAMGPSTVLQLPGADGRDLAALGGLARSAPCFTLQLGSDWEAIPSVLAESLPRGRQPS